MLVQIRTDRHIEGYDDLEDRVTEKVQKELKRYADRLTRVEVYIGDENSAVKSGAKDKRCTVEARAAGLQPLAATHQAESVEAAVAGALASVRRALSHATGKRGER
ncbi:MAG TPA: HPF/RaiA family ribosome-associated protein [Woeseiaceae bacterium]|nr:HPF/RaiA family ribosome-associated protein [Woeseiaceae bacterium]